FFQEQQRENSSCGHVAGSGANPACFVKSEDRANNVRRYFARINWKNQSRAPRGQKDFLKSIYWTISRNVSSPAFTRYNPGEKLEPSISNTPDTNVPCDQTILPVLLNNSTLSVSIDIPSMRTKSEDGLG